jgi:beta-galactosidase
LTDTNDKGLVSFDRKTRKDGFYFFKANWSTEPFVHLTSRRYVDRPYPIVDVKAYSNLPALASTLNGRPLGQTTCEQGICIWHGVQLDKGENRIEAHGLGVDSKRMDAMTWRFEGGPGTYLIRAGTLTGKRGADGRLWGSDIFVEGGRGNFRDKPSTMRGGQPGPVRPVAGTTDQAPYESWREGQFGYALPVPNGRYRITFHFFEPVADRKPGERVFTIKAEGHTALTVDVRGEAGAAWTALARQVDVDVTDGRLNLDFVPVSGLAILSGLEVSPRQ